MCVKFVLGSLVMAIVMAWSALLSISNDEWFVLNAGVAVLLTLIVFFGPSPKLSIHLPKLPRRERYIEGEFRILPSSETALTVARSEIRRR